MSQLKAIVEKELKLMLRFKLDFLTGQVITPLMHFAWFAIIYGGFFAVGAKNIDKLEAGNYVHYLLLGALCASVFLAGVNAFKQRFYREKYWMTVEGVLAAPVSRFTLLVGTGLADLFRAGAALFVMMSFTYIFYPVGFSVILITVAVLVLMFFGCVGFGLVRGAFALSNENYLPLFDYMVLAWTFISCFYYPVSMLPDWLGFFARLNPVYHSVELVRSLWIIGIVPGDLAGHALWLLVFAVVSPVVGVVIFDRVWWRMGIQGY